ncbi:hypothetical protein NUSPORA_02415 [Nucleospora cyclopteri]
MIIRKHKNINSINPMIRCVFLVITTIYTTMKKDKTNLYKSEIHALINDNIFSKDLFPNFYNEYEPLNLFGLINHFKNIIELTTNIDDSDSEIKNFFNKNKSYDKNILKINHLLKEKELGLRNFNDSLSLYKITEVQLFQNLYDKISSTFYDNQSNLEKQSRLKKLFVTKNHSTAIGEHSIKVKNVCSLQESKSNRNLQEYIQYSPTKLFNLLKQNYNPSTKKFAKEFGKNLIKSPKKAIFDLFSNFLGIELERIREILMDKIKTKNDDADSEIKLSIYFINKMVHAVGKFYPSILKKIII